MDMKEKKLTVVGDVDPVCIACKVRKFWRADISHVGLAKEEDKKKNEPPKGGDKKVPNDPVFTPYIPYVQVTEDYPQCCVIC
ncbi:heavy metal-associated isoprenylated plant protein 39-like [Ananas comosus]|uniref:Heavy metal-associated isoprenylated plant protein 39-like n=1 Tax=Ananas comosus TaxID=4615 RepID=A0A199UW75_ANACO|nr:heavy metal-associated isoprenylated plant protein 39-like [Ananas comosus]OAY69067.1 hypothetical protein ACMD2_24319 [Ananas comosus]